MTFNEVNAIRIEIKSMRGWNCTTREDLYRKWLRLDELIHRYVPSLVGKYNVTDEMDKIELGNLVLKMQEAILEICMQSSVDTSVNNTCTMRNKLRQEYDCILEYFNFDNIYMLMAYKSLYNLYCKLKTLVIDIEDYNKVDFAVNSDGSELVSEISKLQSIIEKAFKER